jgi:hypothetical protein
MRFTLAALAAFFACAVVAQAAPRANAPVGGKIDHYLRVNHSPLAGLGSTFVAAGRNCKAHPFDGRLLPAIAGEESEFGRINFHPHNAWGYGQFSWPNYRQAIAKVAHGICFGYLAHGLVTIGAIARVWAPPGINDPNGTNSGWPAAVSRYFAAMGGRHVLLPRRHATRRPGKHKGKLPLWKTVKYGDGGPRVAAIQWLAAGNSRYHLRTYKGHPSGYYGNKTRIAVYWLKWRLGWPKPQGKVAGKTLYRVLLGAIPRPLGWIHLATQRAASGIPGKVSPSNLSLVAALAKVEESQLGVHEIPWGSNSSPPCGNPRPPHKACVLAYQAATTHGGSFWPWCSAFQVWALKQVGITNYGYRSALVQDVVNYAHARGLLHAIPHVGDLVAYWWNQGGQASHIGFVESVSKGGFFTAIEGNEADRVNRIGRSIHSGAWGPWFMTVKR